MEPTIVYVGQQRVFYFVFMDTPLWAYTRKRLPRFGSDLSIIKRTPLIIQSRMWSVH